MSHFPVYERHHAHELEVEAAERAARKVAAAKERRATRVERMNDAKLRTIGMDYDALARQVEEKEAQRLAEKADKARWASQQQLFADLSTRMERQAEEQRLAAQRSLYTALDQQVAIKSMRDTADLERSIKHDRPIRLGDDDSALGVSSAQIFDGEDPLYAQRRALQQAQVRAFAEHDMRVRREARESEREELETFARQSAHFAALGEDIEARARAAKRDKERQALLENGAMAEEKRRREREYRTEQARMDDMMLQTLATPGAGMGILAGTCEEGFLPSGRPRPDRYRGVADPAAVLAENMAFIDQQAAIKEREPEERRRREREEAHLASQAHRAAGLMERRTQDSRERSRQDHLAALAAQAEEERRRKQEAKRKEKTEPFFGNEWWGAFGKSDR